MGAGIFCLGIAAGAVYTGIALSQAYVMDAAEYAEQAQNLVRESACIRQSDFMQPK